MGKNIVIAINKLNPSAAASLGRLKDGGLDIDIIVLRDRRVAPQDRSHIYLGDLVVSEQETDFFDEVQLAMDLAPLRETLLGVVSRGESSIQYLAKLSDICCDWGLSLPTRQSLEIATDKQRMRQAFMEHAPEVTPSFIRVLNSSDATMQSIDQVVGYPLIVKPANLASSLLIQKCDTSEQARQAITEALRTIGELYSRSGRHEKPIVIVEQMLEGDLYSVDSYITSNGEISYCPAVEYVTGQAIGVDDFFLYRRSAPTQLKAADWHDCKRAIERAVQAIGLTATTVHVELCKTKDDWKIIEVGPRVGRYRIEMYREVYGIDHSDNDVKVRLGIEPQIRDEAKAYCSVYSIYPATEGKLERIDSFDEINGLKSLVYMRRLIDDGSNVYHAKHGGHALAEVILACEDMRQFEQDCAWLENNVKAVVA